MHFIVKWPGIIPAVFIGKFEIFFRIHRYLDAVSIPFHSIHMKFFRTIFYFYCIGLLSANNMVIFLTMDRPMNKSLVKTYMLHNINFTIVGPAEWGSAGQHPDSRPGAKAFW